MPFFFCCLVHKVSKYVKDKHGVIPIIWDDMLRQFNPEMMKKYEFNKIGVEIMIWTYIDGNWCDADVILRLQAANSHTLSFRYLSIYSVLSMDFILRNISQYLGRECL